MRPEIHELIEAVRALDLAHRETVAKVHPHRRRPG